MPPPRRAMVVTAMIAAAVGLFARPSRVAAECPYVPPWPPITEAIPSAREIIVGEVVDDFDPSQLDTADGGPRTKALRVTEVLRGDRNVGDLVDIEELLPNWPWLKSSAEAAAIPSCSALQALPGEVVAIAFDARKPGGPMQAGEVTWNQPPTRYNAMGVLSAMEPSPDWGIERERVSLAQLRALASLPTTDAQPLEAEPLAADPWPLSVVIGLIAAALMLVRRTRRV